MKPPTIRQPSRLCAKAIPLSTQPNDNDAQLSEVAPHCVSHSTQLRAANLPQILFNKLVNSANHCLINVLCTGFLSWCFACLEI